MQKGHIKPCLGDVTTVEIIAYINLTTSINIVKTVLKKALLETKNRYDTHVWHEFNFDTDHFSFFKITF